MNKKIIAIITTLAISGGVLMGTAYAGASQLSGYDAYKLAIKDTANLKNETAVLKVSVSDAGKDLVDVSSNIKVNKAANTMSNATTVKSSTGTEDFSTFKQAGKSISKSSTSEVYNVKEENNRKNLNKKAEVTNPEVAKSMEVVLDTLVGSMKNNVAVTDNEDGTKKVAVNLSQENIVPLVNAITSIALTKNNDEPMLNEKAGNLDVKNMLPQLASGITVKSVVVTGDINKDNIITAQVAKIVVTGLDAKGVAHEVTINAALSLSNINATTPNTVDLTGKQVKTVTGHFQGRE
ncbi:hypothetical protein [Clostridium estertheticum]|uniref:hypothetical protein n=1 Tax=Clostridium estertheticum TaxID=238834 RepID=UPI001C7D3E27|nr:hypothetical protein [Clostridium estertheticum]MBX4270955.1 hypothetical protein [Clostridium estertheticum]WLC81186.1 hypothetical protein KTC98_08210 [Clostridium estertheticum]